MGQPALGDRQHACRRLRSASSPTGSIRTILSIDSRSSASSNGLRSTIFVPPLSTLPNISDFMSTASLSRQSSFVSSHRSRMVDDIVIQNQEYVYSGDACVVTPRHSSSLRRTGSMASSPRSTMRAAGPAAGRCSAPRRCSPLGKDIFMTPPPSTGAARRVGRALLQRLIGRRTPDILLAHLADIDGVTSATSVTGTTSFASRLAATLTAGYRLSDAHQWLLVSCIRYGQLPK
ncbi:hypothetical protein HYPSUDRAFT_209770 [Hypholoma sublateritium FD-334 SS-4]|uniref:Uncharacterized protein n=1 Tax=Hypholoma sublateritium (strain FD-334 SS-4) TaxID=945553 RepID=A0A0D2NXF4_HYPSF|nr:hypothetical protein HYPSUDRAFT_209770 [Hypholoma sublateritium FD-334 SS-4]